MSSAPRPSSFSRKEDNDVPKDLFQQASDRFDKLLAQDLLIWQPYDAEDAEYGGFKVQFQTAPHLRYKPHNPVNSIKKTNGHENNPFMNPDPAFVLAHPGPGHTLILNRYPVYKNSLLIHTNEFKLQSDDLDDTDLAACWRTLQILTAPDNTSNPAQKRWVMIYNCGNDAGSSQGHKHMQLWPIPPLSDLGFELFPGQAWSTTDITTLANVPFQHFILKLPKNPVIQDIVTAHTRLLQEVRKCHSEHGSTAYNVAMTENWLMLVPRRSSGGQWKAGGNTAAMLGLLWINNAEERARWEEYGVARHLARLGVPNLKN